MNKAMYPQAPSLTSAELDHRSAFDYLELHALRMPERLAVTGRMGDVSWRRFHADAKRFVCALDALGVRPGQIVAISSPDLYLHWLLVIACEAIGCLSASFNVNERPEDIATLLALADFVLSEANLPGEGRVHVTKAWIDSVLSLADEAAECHPRHQTGPDTPIRIVRSSGSTGTPKAMILRRRMHNFWIRSIIQTNFTAPEIRFYAAYPFTTNCCRSRVETCLRLGATVILGQASQDLITYRATHCWALPRDMLALLQNIQGEMPFRGSIRVILGGAAVSAALHDEIVAKFGADVVVMYATNETGFIGTVDRNGICALLAEAEVQIIDEEGKALPIGEAGSVRARTPGIVEAYVNDPTASQTLFHDGWFLTGDLGMWLAPGRFQILGRRDEVLNVGGIKMAPHAVEDRILRSVPGLHNVGVTSLLNGQGVEQLCVAILPSAEDDPRDFASLVGPCIGMLASEFFLMKLRALPLTESGKIRRQDLKEIFAAAIA